MYVCIWTILRTKTCNVFTLVLCFHVIFHSYICLFTWPEVYGQLHICQFMLICRFDFVCSSVNAFHKISNLVAQICSLLMSMYCSGSCCSVDLHTVLIVGVDFWCNNTDHLQQEHVNNLLLYLMVTLRPKYLTSNTF